MLSALFCAQPTKCPVCCRFFFSLWMLQFSHILEPSQPFLANISWRNFPKNSSTWLGILVHNLNLEFLIHGDYSSNGKKLFRFTILGHEILYYLMHFFFPIIAAMFYIVYFAYKNAYCPWNNVFSLLNCLDLFMRKFNCDV